MKAIEILEALSTKIKDEEHVGNVGIMVQIKDDETLEEGKKAKSILEAFAEKVEIKVVEAGNYQLSQFPSNNYPVFRLSAGPFGKILEK
ncbi:hypothetical protein PYI79_08270 [Staphylococcus epidermidis]|uniref:hypothetical protein n=1 Tax=Staphylococcus epidermidis TaxID=1282 RepID=UPI000D1CDAD7|nr:hypothetical protein [Staphylococcus epidermidis]MCG2138268.1 hypothetical protein [Staphylococcus epidermidis]MDH8771887.1 hypothetical protein [Staphylococcus epidermidis]MDH8773781.1 hypothetical protein [Staphylococcus epidermidis]MDH8818060.1 hypothetical protein [Staphylococcus epidermidis]MDH8845035.1 hypothetical protein [Staphylococcus epidermidis]